MADRSRGMAASATLHCLTGCAVGEILGLLLGTAIGLGAWATVALAVGLAFGFGYALSTLPVLKAGVATGVALRVVLAADTLSIATMEVVDNGVMLLLPGAMDAGLGNPTFWIAMAAALIAAYAAALPVNAHLLARGRGHALTHAYHCGHSGASAGWRSRIPTFSTPALATLIAGFLLGGLAATAAVSLGLDPHATGA